MPERRFTFVRHASTVYNDLHLLNGDPRVPVPLDAGGRVAAAALAPLLAPCAFDLALHTRFARTRETLSLLLGRQRDVPVAIEAGVRRRRRRDLRGTGRTGLPRLAGAARARAAGAGR